MKMIFIKKKVMIQANDVIEIAKMQTKNKGSKTALFKGVIAVSQA
jgi:hypothetical protein